MSESGELFTLSTLNIAAFNLTNSATNVMQNGNLVTEMGTYVKSDGRTGTMGDTSPMGDVNLAVDTFNSKFSEQLPVSASAAALPNVGGSGHVRDLAEAATLSPTLAILVSKFQSTETRAERLALVGQIVKEWASTSTMATTETGAYAGRTLTINGVPGATPAAKAAWLDKLSVIERYNGRTYFQVPAGTGPVTLNFVVTPTWEVGMDGAYSAITDFVYGALMRQTRFTAIDDIAQLDSDGESDWWDFTQISDHFAAAIATNAVQGMNELIEYAKYSGNEGWNAWSSVEYYARTLPPTFNLLALYREMNLTVADTAVYSGVGTEADDILVGGAGSNIIKGGNGSDYIFGGGGNDTLFGGNDDLIPGGGEDVLDGGAGNDYLRGEAGADTYVFGRGAGQDDIDEVPDFGASRDVLLFTADVAPTDVVAWKEDRSLVLAIKFTSDRVKVQGGMRADGATTIGLEEYRFSDGTVWTIEDIKTLMRQATAEADRLRGFAADDTIDGLDGSDEIFGGYGNDTLNGGAGNDYVYGGTGGYDVGTGNDTLVGGAGNDSLSGDDGDDSLAGGDGDDSLNGGEGIDRLDGGIGDDSLWGSEGNDTYVFGRGYGSDTVYVEGLYSSTDVLELLPGIASTDVSVRQGGYNAPGVILRINDTGDEITIEGMRDDAGVTGAAIEEIRFANGTRWTASDIQTALLTGSNSNDSISGFSGNDTLLGLAGDDSLDGYAGDDNLDGGSGDDSLSGQVGNDLIAGGDGSDAINGDAGNDILSGGAGDDTLTGSDGDDSLDGGSGYDSLYGGLGNDTYKFQSGTGKDTISDSDSTAGNSDTLVFSGIAQSQISVSESGSNVVINLVGTPDQVTIAGMAASNWVNDNGIENFQFSDGTLTAVALRAKVPASAPAPISWTGTAEADAYTGGLGNDSLNAAAGDDTLSGGMGDDSLYGGEGADVINGDAGVDAVYGGSGDDTMDGGTGDDTLYGDVGNDVYWFGRGSGRDLIFDNDATAGNIDVLKFKTGILPTDVIVTRSGDAMLLTINGTSDQVVLSYVLGNDGAGNSYNIEEIRFADSAIVWNFDALKNRLLAATDAADKITGFSADETINSGDGGDTVRASGGADVVDGGSGDDSLFGDAGNDTLMGQAGNDLLDGGDGNDRLDGGLGRDALQGGMGSDTYVFRTGSGRDTINEANDATSIDTVEIQSGIRPEQLVVSRSGSWDLNLTLVGSGDRLTLQNQLVNDGAGSYKIE